MKKIITIALSIIILLFMCSSLSAYLKPDCQVAAIESGIVTTLDPEGNLWEFSRDGFSIGDTITLEMNGNLTFTIYDDSVVGIR